MIKRKGNQTRDTRQLVSVKIAREQIHAVPRQSQIDLAVPQRDDHLARGLIEHFYFEFRICAPQRRQSGTKIFLHRRCCIANAQAIAFPPGQCGKTSAMTES